VAPESDVDVLSPKPATMHVFAAGHVTG
jgi:hypothetical protein